MQPLRRLASQTIVYGMSSIIGRFLNYLLVPLYTYYFAPAEYGIVAELYAYMGFLTVLLLLGMETGYFRYRADTKWTADLVYATALRSILSFNGIALSLILIFLQPIAVTLRYTEHPEYLAWMVMILGLDAIGALAFAKLRAENRALRFAGIKFIEILVNVGLNLILIGYCRQAHILNPDSWAGQWWNPNIGVGYVLLANLFASGLKLLLLMVELSGIRAGFNWDLLRQMLRYSLPMVLIGLAGIVNEMLDRVILKYLLPYDAVTNMAQLGIYSACYKLSIVMSLFIQAFRYAGEPFFFAYADKSDARRIYADVLHYFVIFCVLVFLIVTLYIEVFKYFVGAPYRVGLQVTPILLLANLFLGIYVNLSIWYKLSDHTLLGAAVSVFGAVITLLLLLWWVPIFGYMGAAWATLVCYFSMALLSYVLGCRYYPVPYNVPKVLGYIVLGIGIYLGHAWIISQFPISSIVAGTIGIALFSLLAVLIK